VLRLVSAFVDIAFHRRGPDSLPASTFLLGLAAAVYLVLLSLSVQLGRDASPLLLAAFLFETVLGALFVWSLLRAFALERRLKQTLTALFGIDALMTALSLPILLSARSLEESGSDPGLPQLIYIAVSIWNIDVWGFVVGRAIGRPYFLGLAFVVGWVLLITALHSAMFPAAPV
jgi:CDP-diglyceride synthetase